MISGAAILLLISMSGDSGGDLFGSVWPRSLSLRKRDDSSLMRVFFVLLITYAAIPSSMSLLSKARLSLFRCELNSPTIGLLRCLCSSCEISPLYASADDASSSSQTSSTVSVVLLMRAGLNLMVVPFCSSNSLLYKRGDCLFGTLLTLPLY